MFIIFLIFHIIYFFNFIQSSASYVPIKNPSITSGTESDDSGATKSSVKVVRFNKVAEVMKMIIDYVSKYDLLPFCVLFNYK